MDGRDKEVKENNNAKPKARLKMGYTKLRLLMLDCLFKEENVSYCSG